MSKKVKIYKAGEKLPAITAKDTEIMIKYCDNEVSFKNRNINVSRRDGLSEKYESGLSTPFASVGVFMFFSGIAFWIDLIVEVIS